MKVWEKIEIEAAKFFGGVIPKKNKWWQSLPDVISEKYLVEVKYREKLPTVIKRALKQLSKYQEKEPIKIPVVFLKTKNPPETFIIIRKEDFNP